MSSAFPVPHRSLVRRTLPRAVLLWLAAALLILAAATGAARAGDAMGGVDPVILRDMGRPVIGNAAISTRWQGREWTFANEANRATFEADPRAYSPGFAGNCPVLLAQGTKRQGNPDLFVVVRDTLYLTSSADAQAQLTADPQDILARAAAQWKRLR